MNRTNALRLDWEIAWQQRARTHGGFYFSNTTAILERIDGGWCSALRLNRLSLSRASMATMNHYHLKALEAAVNNRSASLYDPTLVVCFWSCSLFSPRSSAVCTSGLSYLNRFSKVGWWGGLSHSDYGNCVYGWWESPKFEKDRRILLCR